MTKVTLTGGAGGAAICTSGAGGTAICTSTVECASPLAVEAVPEVCPDYFMIRYWPGYT